MTIQALIDKQNPDGGWPYVRGGSWTEPAVYAVMALLAAGEAGPAQKGIRWLFGLQRRDGGWAPRPSVEDSCWVTGLVALLGPEHLGEKRYIEAVGWLAGTAGKESSRTYRLRQWLLGFEPPAEQVFPGWPWLPGAAAWVGPTAIGVMALDKVPPRLASDHVRARVEAGRQFLLMRMCRHGGWNYGPPRTLGVDANPYPETTGMALAALRGADSRRLAPAIECARRFLSSSHSADALNWLRLGLTAHGQLPPGYALPPEVAHRTVPETSLHLVLSAAEPRHSFFWLT